MTRRRATDAEAHSRARDPGLQPERTLLSWQRTLIAMVVIALLYLREPLTTGAAVPLAGPLTPHRLVPALALVAVAGVLIVHARRRWRATDHGRHDDATGTPPAPVVRPWALFLLSLATAGFAVSVAVGALLA